MSSDGKFGDYFTGLCPFSNLSLGFLIDKMNHKLPL